MRLKCVLYRDEGREPTVLSAVAAPPSMHALRVFLEKQTAREIRFISYWDYRTGRYEALGSIRQLAQPEAVLSKDSAAAAAASPNHNRTITATPAITNSNISVTAEVSVNASAGGDTASTTATDNSIYRAQLWLESSFVRIDQIDPIANRDEFAELAQHVRHCAGNRHVSYELTRAARLEYGYLARCFDRTRQRDEEEGARANSASGGRLRANNDDVRLLFYSNNAWPTTEVMQRGFLLLDDIPESTEAALRATAEAAQANQSHQRNGSGGGVMLLPDTSTHVDDGRCTRLRPFTFTSGMLNPRDRKPPLKGPQKVMLCEVAPGRSWRVDEPITSIVGGGGQCGSSNTSRADADGLQRPPEGYDSIVYEEAYGAVTGAAADGSSRHSSAGKSRGGTPESATQKNKKGNRCAGPDGTTATTTTLAPVTQVMVGHSHQALPRYLLTIQPCDERGGGLRGFLTPRGRSRSRERKEAANRAAAGGGVQSLVRPTTVSPNRLLQPQQRRAADGGGGGGGPLGSGVVLTPEATPRRAAPQSAGGQSPPLGQRQRSFTGEPLRPLYSSRLRTGSLSPRSGGGGGGGVSPRPYTGEPPYQQQQQQHRSAEWPRQQLNSSLVPPPQQSPERAHSPYGAVPPSNTKHSNGNTGNGRLDSRRPSGGPIVSPSRAGSSPRPHPEYRQDPLVASYRGQPQQQQQQQEMGGSSQGRREGTARPDRGGGGYDGASPGAAASHTDHAPPAVMRVTAPPRACSIRGSDYGGRYNNHGNANHSRVGPTVAFRGPPPPPPLSASAARSPSPVSRRASFQPVSNLSSPHSGGGGGGGGVSGAVTHSPSALAVPLSLRCAAHPGSLSNVYCIPCNELTCPYCASLGPHRGHEVIAADAHATAVRQSMQGLCHQLSQWLDHFARVEQQLATERAEAEAAQGRRLQALKGQLTEARRALEARELLLARQLADHGARLAPPVAEAAAVRAKYAAALRPLEGCLRAYQAGSDGNSNSSSNANSAGVGASSSPLSQVPTLQFLRAAPQLMAEAANFFRGRDREEEARLKAAIDAVRRANGHADDLLAAVDTAELRRQIDLLGTGGGRATAAAPSVAAVAVASPPSPSPPPPPLGAAGGYGAWSTSPPLQRCGLSGPTAAGGAARALVPQPQVLSPSPSLNLVGRCLLDLQRGHIWAIQNASRFFCAGQTKAVCSTPFRLKGMNWELRIAALPRAEDQALGLLMPPPPAVNNDGGGGTSPCIPTATAQQRPQSPAAGVSVADRPAPQVIRFSGGGIDDDGSVRTPRRDTATAEASTLSPPPPPPFGHRGGTRVATEPADENQWLGIFLFPQGHRQRLDFRVVAFSEVTWIEWKVTGWKEAFAGKGWGLYPFLQRKDLMRLDKLARDNIVKICITPISDLY